MGGSPRFFDFQLEVRILVAHSTKKLVFIVWCTNAYQKRNNDSTKVASNEIDRKSNMHTLYIIFSIFVLVPDIRKSGRIDGQSFMTEHNWVFSFFSPLLVAGERGAALKMPPIFEMTVSKGVGLWKGCVSCCFSKSGEMKRERREKEKIVELRLTNSDDHHPSQTTNNVRFHLRNIP